MFVTFCVMPRASSRVVLLREVVVVALGESGAFTVSVVLRPLKAVLVLVGSPVSLVQVSEETRSMLS